MCISLLEATHVIIDFNSPSHVNFLCLNVEVDKMSQRWCLHSLVLPIGHFRRVTWWRWLLNEDTSSSVLPKFLWLSVASSCSQTLSIMLEPFLGTWTLESSENFEAYLAQLGEKYHWKIWKLATHLVMGRGLHFTVKAPTILSFFCDPRVSSYENNKVYVPTSAFFVTGNNCLFGEY